MSSRLSQDPLEKIFGCQRQRGKSSENPNVYEFCKNTQALRVINSVCGNVPRGNCRGSKHAIDWEAENKPLPKRRKCGSENRQPQATEKHDHQPQHSEKHDHQPQHIEKCGHQLQHTEKCDHQPQHTEKCDHQPQHTEKCDNQPQHTDKCDYQPQHTKKCSHQLEHAERHAYLVKSTENCGYEAQALTSKQSPVKHGQNPETIVAHVNKYSLKQ